MARVVVATRTELWAITEAEGQDRPSRRAHARAAARAPGCLTAVGCRISRRGRCVGAGAPGAAGAAAQGAAGAAAHALQERGPRSADASASRTRPLSNPPTSSSPSPRRSEHAAPGRLTAQRAAGATRPAMRSGVIKEPAQTRNRATAVGFRACMTLHWRWRHACCANKAGVARAADQTAFFLRKRASRFLSSRRLLAAVRPRRRKARASGRRSGATRRRAELRRGFASATRRVAGRSRRSR